VGIGDPSQFSQRPPAEDSEQQEEDNTDSLASYVWSSDQGIGTCSRSVYYPGGGGGG